MSERFEHPDVIVCPNGPILLRGTQTVRDAGGTVHTTRRSVSAVCACGKSSSQPWCDGTHKLIPESRR